MRNFKTCTLPLVIACLIAGIAAAEDARPKRILFIGNSYTRGVKPGIETFFRRDGKGYTFSFITPGGRRLSNHLQNEQTLRSIATGDWDLIVLQEQSQLPSLPPLEKEFIDSGQKLIEAIKKSEAKAMLFLTWGRRDGDKANAKLNPDFSTMQQRLNRSYTTLAEQSGATVAPVGKAWAIVREESPDLFRRLYSKDGSHPSRHGAYLSAAVFYAMLTGEDVATVAVKFPGVSDGEARLLRSAAAKAVKSASLDANK